MAKPVDKAEETEWQKLARQKKAGEKIKEVSALSSLSLDHWILDALDVLQNSHCQIQRGQNWLIVHVTRNV